MKERLYYLLIALMVLALPTLGQAQLIFTTNSGAITITGYNTNAGLNVVIPATTNGYPVTSIQYHAFYNSTVTSVILGTNLNDIGPNAFWRCYSLTNVTIPSSVNEIDEGAFAYCSSLTSETIPSSVTFIDVVPFYNCFNLTNITVAAGNPNYSSLNGVLFDKTQATLIDCPSGVSSNYVIPNSVTTIVEYAFYYCHNLTSMTIPNSVTNIQGDAFNGCSNLTSLVISTNVTTIADEAFSYCYNLPSVIIPKSVTIIGFSSFSGCSSLTNVTIPNSVTNIGSSAFSYCSSLTSVTIPNSVTTIGEYTFNYCTSLTSITIPNSITNIGAWAFSYCPSLNAVYFQGNAPAPTNDTTVFAYTASGAKAYYLSSATGWGATFDGIPTAVILPPPPALGISTYGSQPAMFFPTATGTNYVLQMTTNLATGPWVTVSNGIAISGVVVTNPPANVFFRLH